MKLLVIPGEGIGPICAESAFKIIEEIQSIINLDIEFQFQYKIDDFTALIEKCRRIKYIYIGPFDLNNDFGLPLTFRKSLDLYANIAVIPLIVKDNPIEIKKILIVRENIEGMYSGSSNLVLDRCREKVGIDNNIAHYSNCRRIMQLSFNLGKKYGFRFCCVTKSNVLKSSEVFLDAYKDISSLYPEVQADYYLVDSFVTRFIRSPLNHDVIITTNFIGDILTGVANALTVENVISRVMTNTEVFAYSPLHGTGKDISDLSKINPVSTYLAFYNMILDATRNRVLMNYETSFIRLLLKILLNGRGKLNMTDIEDKVLLSIRKDFGKNDH